MLEDAIQLHYEQQSLGYTQASLGKMKFKDGIENKKLPIDAADAVIGQNTVAETDVPDVPKHEVVSDKKQIRAIKNRAAAQASRERKRKLTEKIESENKRLREENEYLKERLRQLEANLSQVVSQAIPASNIMNSVNSSILQVVGQSSALSESLASSKSKSIARFSQPAVLWKSHSMRTIPQRCVQRMLGLERQRNHRMWSYILMTIQEMPSVQSVKRIPNGLKVQLVNGRTMKISRRRHGTV